MTSRRWSLFVLSQISLPTMNSLPFLSSGAQRFNHCPHRLQLSCISFSVGMVWMPPFFVGLFYYIGNL